MNVRGTVQTRRTFTRQMLAAGAASIAPRVVAHALPASLPASLPAAAAGSDPISGPASLRAHATARDLFAGMAVNLDLLEHDVDYRRTIVEQSNIVVAESAMKWKALRPDPDRYSFDDADRFIAFAEQHGMAIRGHTLCWHEDLPDWFAATVNARNAEEILIGHIQTVVGRYKGRIRAWDVVNEAIHPADGQPDGLRSSPWNRLLGPRYIGIAFRAARAADPDALLTYNDYGIETEGADDRAKREAVLGLLKRMRRDGIPIDALGIQSHLSAASAGSIDDRPGSGLGGMIEKTRALGLKVFVTELDVNDDGINADDPVARGNAVGAIYRGYATGLLANPAVTDVLTWGVTDRFSWLNARGASSAKLRPKHPERKRLCLPFDDGYQPRPAFYALRDALDLRGR